MRISVYFGEEGVFNRELDSDRVTIGSCEVSDEKKISVKQELTERLVHPLEFPELYRSLVPGDRVVVAMDPKLPEADSIIPPVFDQFDIAGVRPSDVTLLCPVGNNNVSVRDPRGQLPSQWRNDVKWVTADGKSEEQLRYLANTAEGYRVYLNQYLVDADFVLPVSCLRYEFPDSYFGPHHVLYPSLSNESTQERCRVQAISKSSKGDILPRAVGSGPKPVSVTDEANEVAWLLGVQFSIAAIVNRRGDCAHILAGETRAVFDQGKTDLDQIWGRCYDRRSEVVICGLPGDDSEQTAASLVSALSSAQQLVSTGGTIIMLTDISEIDRSGFQLFSEASEPYQVQTLFHDDMPAEEIFYAERIADVVSSARVYLRSSLEPRLVEDMFMIPLQSLSEVDHLLSHDHSINVLNDAQHVRPVVKEG